MQEEQNTKMDLIKRSGGIHRFTITNEKGEVVSTGTANNMWTTAGITSLFNVYLGAATQITTWYLALICAARSAADGAVGSGSTTFTSASASFVSADAGKTITVAGAGVAAATLSTTIASVTNGTTVVLSNAASTTVTSAVWVLYNRTVTDGAIPSSGTTLTSATAAFVSGDVGRQVTIFGAGAAGAALATTISGFTNSTTVTVGTAASTTVTGATVSVGPLFAIADTMSSHTGWFEVLGAMISNATRPAWTAGAASGTTTVQISNTSSPAVFNMSGSNFTGTIYAHALAFVSNNTLNGTTGTLYSLAEFQGGAQALSPNFGFSDTYQLTLVAG